MRLPTQNSRLLILLHCLLLPLIMAAQPWANSPKLNLTHLNKTDGLASNIVYCISKGHRGFLWFGTANGLQMFDGTRFIDFDLENPEFGKSEVYDILIDSKQRMWAASNIGLFTSLSGSNTFVKVALEADPFLGFPTKLMEDSHGNIWISSTSCGLYRKKQKEQKWMKVSPPEMTVMGSTLTEDKATGNIWFRTIQSNAIYLANSDKLVQGEEVRKYYPIPNLPLKFNVAHIDNNQNLWLTMPNSDNRQANLTVINLNSRQIENVYPGEFLIAPGIKQPTFVQVNTYGKPAGVFIPEVRKLLPFTNLSPEIGNEFHDACEDDEGNLWFATNHGVYVATATKKKYITHYPLKDKRDRADVTPLCFLETHDKQRWVGTYFRGIFRLDRNMTVQENQLYTNKNIPPTITDKKNIDDFNSVWALLQLKNGTIWAGGQAGTLHAYRPDGTAIKLWKPEILEGQTIRSMAEDPKGFIWLGGQRGGLFKLNPANFQITTFIEREPNSKNPIRDIKCMDDGTLLLAKGGYCLRFDPTANNLKYCSTLQKGTYVNGFKQLSRDSFLAFGAGLYLFNSRLNNIKKSPDFQACPPSKFDGSK